MTVEISIVTRKNYISQSCEFTDASDKKKNERKIKNKNKEKMVMKTDVGNDKEQRGTID